MRRKDREITDTAQIEEILNQASVIRLAMIDDDYPYIVAMNFAYVDGVLYMHSAKEGRKISILSKNKNVSFQAETGVEIILNETACACSTKYKSVFGTGHAYLIDEKAEKIKALDAIMSKHTGRSNFEYSERAFEKTLAIKVEIVEITGKKSD